MAIMKFNEQFYRNYNELYTMIKQCYCEVAILEVYIELQNDRPDLYNKVINISDQFVFLLQKDLEWTLWKIYYDNDSKANTIPKFRNTVNDMLRYYPEINAEETAIQKVCELVENLHDVNVVGNIPENMSAELMIHGFNPKGEIYNEELRKELSPKHAKRI